MSKFVRQSARLSFHRFLATAVALIAGLSVSAVEAQVPTVMPIGARVAYSQTTSGTTTKTSRDAAGNLFFMDTTPQIFEIPVSGPEQLVIPSTDAAMTGGVQAMTVDPAGNIYVAQANKMYEIPRNSNGTYGTSTLIATGLSSATTGYYYSSNDLAVDGSGNIYISITGTGGTNPCSATSAPCPGIATINSSIANPAGTGVKYIVGGTFTNQITHNATGLALDGSGNLFYADGTSVYELTASAIAATNSSTTATPVTIGYYTGGPTCVGCTAIAAPNRVYTDKVGNVFVAASGKIYVIVSTGSTFSTSSQTYLLPGTISGNSTSGLGATIDNQGTFVIPFGGSIERYGGGNFYAPNPGNVYGAITAAAGSAGVGVSTKNPTFSYLFTSTTTLNATTPYAVVNSGSAYGGAAPATFTISTGTTTCTAGTTYTAGQTCNISVGYKPYLAGVMGGAIVLYGTSGNVLNVATLQGHASGAAVVVDNGVQSLVGTGYKNPAGVAVDAAGNMYVADPASNAVYQYAKGSTSAGTAIGTGLVNPTGVAVDAAGNVYIADTGNNRVVYVPNYLAGLSTANQTVVTTTGFTLNQPRGVAIDPYGNLFIADTGNARVLELANPLAGATNTGIPVTVGTGYTSPYAVAVDAFSNVYVADKGANSIVLIPGGTGFLTGTTNQGSAAQTTVGSGFSAPIGVAVDASGSVYVADSGNARIVRLPSLAGVLPTSSTVPVVMYSGLNKPFGIALDATNDVYYTDQNAPGLFFVLRSAASAGTDATIAFGSTAVNGTGNATAILSNAGLTTALTVSAVTAPTTPFASPSTTCGAVPFTVSAGSSCTFSLTFSPTSAGTATPGSLVLTDNALGATAATHTTSLTGNAAGAVASLTLSGASSIVYGDTATYTVTAKDSGGNVVSMPTGTPYTLTITGGAGSSSPYNSTFNSSGTFLLPALNSSATPYSLTVTINSITSSPAIAVTVSKAPLYLSANSVSRVFDAVNPTLTASYSGFGNGDTASVVTGTATVTTTATRVSPFGSYPITVSGTLSATNYTITLVNSSLTVTGSAPQSIIFPALPGTSHPATVILTSQATSGLPVTYSVAGTAGATLSGSTLTISNAGTVIVTAIQGGNNSYAAATSVTRTFTAQ